MESGRGQKGHPGLACLRPCPHRHGHISGHPPALPCGLFVLNPPTGIQQAASLRDKWQKEDEAQLSKVAFRDDGPDSSLLVTDADLAPEAFDEERLLAKYKLLFLRADAVYASPLTRAVQVCPVAPFHCAALAFHSQGWSRWTWRRQREMERRERGRSER